MILGAVIESIAGQSHETCIAQNILQPLGMSQTGFVYSPAMAGKAVAGRLPVVYFYTPLLPRSSQMSETMPLWQLGTLLVFVPVLVLLGMPWLTARFADRVLDL